MYFKRAGGIYPLIEFSRKKCSESWFCAFLVFDNQNETCSYIERYKRILLSFYCSITNFTSNKIRLT